MSTFLWKLDPDGENLSIGHFTTPGKQRDALLEAFPDADKYETNDPLNAALTNIYRTKDGRFFHVHGRFPSRPFSPLAANAWVRDG